MKKDEVIEIIKKRFGTSDEDLQDLDTIMTALDGIDKAEYLENQIAIERSENEKKLKDLDDAWRKRYRDRFFAGDTDISDVVDKMEEAQEEKEDASEITIDEFLEKFNEKGEYK